MPGSVANIYCRCVVKYGCVGSNVRKHTFEKMHQPGIEPRSHRWQQCIHHETTDALLDLMCCFLGLVWLGTGLGWWGVCGVRWARWVWGGCGVGRVDEVDGLDGVDEAWMWRVWCDGPGTSNWLLPPSPRCQNQQNPSSIYKTLCNMQYTIQIDDVHQKSDANRMVSMELHENRYLQASKHANIEYKKLAGEVAACKLKGSQGLRI